MKAVALFSLVAVVVCKSKKRQPHAGPDTVFSADPVAFPRAPHSYYGKRDTEIQRAPAVHKVGGGAPAVTVTGANEPIGAYGDIPNAPVALEPHFYYNKRDARQPTAPQAASVLAAVAPAAYGHAYHYPGAPYTPKYYNKREAQVPRAYYPYTAFAAPAAGGYPYAPYTHPIKREAEEPAEAYYPYIDVAAPAAPVVQYLPHQPQANYGYGY